MNIIIEKMFTRLNTSKYTKIILVAFPILPILVYFFNIYSPSIYFIHPDRDKVNFTTSVVAYNDQKEHNGNSEVQILKNNSNKLSFKYTLKNGAFPPYAKIRLGKSDGSFINLEPYHDINIRIKAVKGARIQFYLASPIPKFTNPDKDITYLYSLNNLNVTNQSAIIRLKTEQLYTPDWWYSFNNKTEQSLTAPDLSQVQFIYFANCINIKNDLEDVVEIEELSFHVNYIDFYIFSGCFLFFYYGAIGLIYFILTRKHRAEVNFQYKKLETQNYQDKEEALIFGYLSINYFQQDLTILTIQNATGLHERKISAIVKAKTGLNFKQYLNQLRISEAEKLLAESDLPISEIAFKVGYGNPPHFNRVFKSIKNCSPNDYRKDQSKAFSKNV